MGLFYGSTFGTLGYSTKRDSNESDKMYSGGSRTTLCAIHGKRSRDCGKEVLMQEGGALYHFARIPTAYKDGMDDKRIDRPAQSSDLSPIESIWKIPKDRINATRHRITSIPEWR
jgi:hypothetical protein